MYIERIEINIIGGQKWNVNVQRNVESSKNLNKKLKKKRTMEVKKITEE